MLLPCHTLLEAELPKPSERETDLQELRKFDLDWQFGPCTGKSIFTCTLIVGLWSFTLIFYCVEYKRYNHT